MVSRGFRFILRRTEDISGISGSGDVADGVEFAKADFVVLCWRETARTKPSITVFNSIEAMLEVHGHAGLTKVVWVP